jgi:hypothetical protein
LLRLENPALKCLLKLLIVEISDLRSCRDAEGAPRDVNGSKLYDKTLLFMGKTIEIFPL